MKILVAGATGMVGRALVPELAKSHTVSVLGRSRAKAETVFPEAKVFEWSKFSDCETEKFDCVINLCGENIGAARWSNAQKKRILESRIESTKRLAELCQKNPKTRFLCASAIGIYGMQKTPEEQQKVVYDESSNPPEQPLDFLSEVGIAWENAAKALDAKRLVSMRFGVILNQHDGALAKMLTPFKLGLGGKIASGEQPFSWVSLADIVSAILFLLNHPKIHGPVNIVSPEILPQHAFAKALAKALHRPAIFPLPNFMVKLQFGEMGQTLLSNGLSVKSSVLEKAGFTFKHPTLNAFLTDEFGG